ncbi:uncharacterized protein LOC123556897 [Mercenaria mercenaria]|uniref:uncharacterized protein LOC123556897 n=1 Tax=Mercenaria mercenaria TaxID=6596 RepID=UPI00234EC968|nr:uncharacterized protein LOC123556897 [Mercenaria mercenaria]
MNFLCCVCFLAIPLGTIAEEYKLEYYETVSLECDASRYNFTSTQPVVKKYWLVPNGNLVSASEASGHFEIDSNFTLTVNRISDDDFGYYFCLLVRDDHNLDRIVHGLNTDGPFFGDLLEKYKKNAMIGGIAAGTLFVIVAGSCIVWQLRYQRKSQRNKAVDELDKAIDGYDLRAYDNVAIDNVELEEKAKEASKTDERSDTGDNL